MSVPLSLFLLGLIISATLGFAAGRMVPTRSPKNTEKTPPPPKPLPPPPPVPKGVDPLEEAWERLPPDRVVLHLRLDGIDTWRRTHGQSTIDHFCREIERVLVDTLPVGSRSVRREAEFLAVAPGDYEVGVLVAQTLRDTSFAHPNSDEAQVSAGLGLAEETGESLEVQQQRAFAAMSEAARRRRGAVGQWSLEGVRHLRPVDAPT